MSHGSSHTLVMAQQLKLLVSIHQLNCLTSQPIIYSLLMLKCGICIMMNLELLKEVCEITESFDHSFGTYDFSNMLLKPRSRAISIKCYWKRQKICKNLLSEQWKCLPLRIAHFFEKNIFNEDSEDLCWKYKSFL